MSELEALLRLNMAQGVGAIKCRKLVEHFGSPEAVFGASESQLACVSDIGPRVAYGIREAARSADVESELKLAEQHQVRIVPYTDPSYPRNLRSVYDPPLLLYVKGELKDTDALAMAIVGSRRASFYGQSQAERLASGLATAGFCIISGLARGIDAAAHRGALKAKGRTIAVLGSGLARIYPREHGELADLVAKNGALLSELPMATAPNKGNFPPRNRLISGLALGVVVVEAAVYSGSLVTAKWAAEQGREVFAVPGPVDSLSSRGPHRLIKDGAKLVENVQDIVQELGPLAETLEIEGETVEDPRALSLNAQESQIFNLLSSAPKSIDQIIEETGLPAAATASTLLILEIKKLAKQLSGKRFVKA